MILTNCAACAAPLAHNAPRCIRCHTRYCDATCQHDHWRRGHKQICKKIHRGGNAEQYYADKKYKEAVAVAVEACAEDTKGQKCYICLEAVHPRTGEGLVRGCACGDRDGVSSPELGVAHVSCLADQAKLLVAETEEHRMGHDARVERWDRWHTCSLCEQDYHGVVMCAMAWACWKTYVSRPEDDLCRNDAMTYLSNGLRWTVPAQDEEALVVLESQLATLRRVEVGNNEHTLLIVHTNISSVLMEMGFTDKALRMKRAIHARRLAINGAHAQETVHIAVDVSHALVNAGRIQELLSFARDQIILSRDALGEDHHFTQSLRFNYATALLADGDATEAVNILEDLARTANKIYGKSHPNTEKYLAWFTYVQSELAGDADVPASKISKEYHAAFDKATAELKAAVASPVVVQDNFNLLRFDIGARVECHIRVGGALCWATGRVVAHYYREPGWPPEKFAPYQVQLDSGGLIYAHMDSERSIRAVTP